MSWWRRLFAAADGERRDAAARPDAWAPALDTGYWRNAYGECCDALLAYDRVVATLPAGGLRDELAVKRDQLPEVLARARYLAEHGAALDPTGPMRDPELMALLADDPLEDLGEQLGPPPTTRIMARLVTVRRELWRSAEEAARLAVRVHENAFATDTATWLTALASGVLSARRADRGYP